MVPADCEGLNIETTLAATDITTVDLQNEDEWFTRLCREETARRWIDKAVENGHSVYLVVGMRTHFRAATVPIVANGRRVHVVSRPATGAQAEVDITATESKLRTGGVGLCGVVSECEC